MQWPVSELEHWSIFFSIDDHKDKPIIEQDTPDSVTINESKGRLRELLG